MNRFSEILCAAALLTCQSTSTYSSQQNPDELVPDTVCGTVEEIFQKIDSGERSAAVLNNLINNVDGSKTKIEQSFVCNKRINNLSNIENKINNFIVIIFYKKIEIGFAVNRSGIVIYPYVKHPK